MRPPPNSSPALIWAQWLLSFTLFFLHQSYWTKYIYLLVYQCSIPKALCKRYWMVSWYCILSTDNCRTGKSYLALFSAHTFYPMVVLPYCWLQTFHLSIISQRDSVLLDSMLSGLTITVVNQMLGFSAPCSLHRAWDRVLFFQCDVMYASYIQSPWKKKAIHHKLNMICSKKSLLSISAWFCFGIFFNPRD
jgi:hypothetical protein